jgi:glycosyltransferase involved in cell wall biosynthesis
MDPARRKDPLFKSVIRSGYRTMTGIRAVALARRAKKDAPPSVFYGGARSGDNGGPLVKVQRLQRAFPQTSGRFNLVYSLSNAPYLSPFVLDRLKARGTAIVHNQNGVFYPGWYDGDWERENARMAAAYHRAGHVFWQSSFCRDCADWFLGTREGPGEVLFNAVDVSHFAPGTPRPVDPTRPFRFLLTGKIQAHLSYRLEDTIAGLAAARADGLNAALMIAGHLDTGATAAALSAAAHAGVQAHVDLRGPYTQDTAPDIYRAADAYVMTKHADPCPNTVIEAMACGLPVVYVASGGVPELVPGCRCRGCRRRQLG